MNITVPALIIIGGIGFSVLSDLYRARRWRTLSLHTKVMLSGTAGLSILAGRTMLSEAGSAAAERWRISC